MTKNRKPSAFDIPTSSENNREATSRPAKSIEIDDTRLEHIHEEDDIFSNAELELTKLEEQAGPAKLKRGRFSFLRLAFLAISTLITLSFGLWVETLITDLFARSQTIGWLGLAAFLTFAFAIAAIIGREIWGLRKLKSVEQLRSDISKALPQPNIKSARSLIKRVTNVVSDRAETARGRQILEETKDEIIDGDNLLALAETKLLSNLDSEARKLILTSAKRVSVVTAVSPKALIDTGYVLYEMVSLTGKLARLYGSRPGFFGSIKLLRSIITHLAVTGTIAVGESLIHQFVSHSVAGKLSARFGEGVLNGIMTTRFGIVAMELVRPMPFNRLERPQLKGFLSELASLNSSNSDKN